MSSTRHQLGQYLILGPIGAGGMGEVYVARDPVLGRKVAIKVLPVRLSGDRDTLARFTQEARSASALNHPNIVTIHEVGADPSGAPYIVMEYVEGRDLRSYVDDGPPQNKKLLEIAAQIAEGLAAAHERGIVHRDLKPENLMVTNDGFVKILDFGLAKIIRPTPGDGDVTAQLEMPGTTPGTILGTVGYMSPEQASGRSIDLRSDQFTLGAILYELATGKPAFDGETAIDTLSAILHDDPEPIQKLNPRAPAQFCWIVGRLLSKDPKDRYASTRDLAQELRAIRDRIATLAGGVELPVPSSGWKSKPLLWGGLLVALAAAGVFVAERGAIGGKPASAPAPPAKNYLAVTRFKDLSGDAHGQLMADGFAETLTARMAHFPSVQIMRPPTPDVANAADVRSVARDLGADLVLTGSMQREGERLRIKYAIVDIRTGLERGDLVEGTVNDLFGIEDRVADSVAVTLNLGAPLIKPALADPSLSQSQFLEAIGYLRRYDDPTSVDSAISTLSDLGSRSNSASVQAALGRAYLYKFQLTHDPTWAVPATAACQRAVTADPQNPDVRYTLGELRRQTGQIPEAIAEYKAALAQQPNNADAVLGLAEAYKAVGKVNEAEAAYKQAIAMQPQFWGGYNKLGAFYAGHARYADSAKNFERVLQLMPDNLRATINLGAVYAHMGRYEDAISVFSKAIAKKPTDQAYNNLGTCYYFVGRFTEAATAFQQATTLTPSKYLYWENLGDALRWIPAGRPRASEAYDRAIELANRELTLNAHESAARAALAICLAKRGDPPAATKQITRALQEDASSANLYKAAIIANLRGDPNEAVTWLKKAIDAGYNTADLQRDPELDTLRQNGLLRDLLKTR